MPYIKQDKRDALDSVVTNLVDVLRQLEADDPENNFEGNVNYAVTKIIDACYRRSYRDINNVVGVLECIKQEYYRRVAGPYENQKSFENGDVYTEQTAEQALRGSSVFGKPHIFTPGKLSDPGV